MGDGRYAVLVHHTDDGVMSATGDYFQPEWRACERPLPGLIDYPLARP